MVAVAQLLARSAKPIDLQLLVKVAVAQLVRPACRQAGRLHCGCMDHYVYIIQSESTEKFYTGMTNDINRRLSEHNQHLSNTHTTKYITDYKLVFCQICTDRVEARRLEKYLKSGCGREIREEIVK